MAKTQAVSASTNDITQVLVKNLAKLQKQFSVLLSNSFSNRQTSSRRSSSFLGSMFKSGMKFNFKKYGQMAAGLLIVIALGWGLNKLVKQDPTSASNSNQEEITVAGPTKTHQLDYEVSFPLRDQDLNEISNLKYQITSAELRDEIIVRGQRARAVEGRSFLILNLKVANEFDQAIEIDSRDYIRLVINGNETEKLAPEIHNDPVEVQAISVKNTRLGFTIDDNFDSLSLQIGEITGEKESLELDLK